MIGGMIRKFGKDVTVQRKVTNEDGAYSTETWELKFQTVGVLDAIRGTKNAKYDQVNEQSTHFLYVYPCDITIEDRVLINNKVYNVTYPDDPMNAGEFLQVELELQPYGV